MSKNNSYFNNIFKKCNPWDSSSSEFDDEDIITKNFKELYFFKDLMNKSSSLSWNLIQNNKKIIKEKKLKPKFSDKPISLINDDDVRCYMNAALQALLPTLDISITSKIKDNRLMDKPVCHLLNAFLSSYSKQCSFNIKKHIRNYSKLSYFGSQFSWNYQEDSHEFLTSLLDKLKDELEQFSKENNITNQVSESFELKHEATLYCKNCHKTKNGNTNISSDFGLMLEIDKNFDTMLERTLIHDIEDFTCEKCDTEKGTFEARINILSLPKNLIICIKRFGFDSSYNSYKINHPVELEETIEVPLSINNDTEMVKYELVSIICHLGTLASGHYTSFVKINGEWYLANDKDISDVTFSEIVDITLGKNYVHIYKKLKLESQ